MIAKLYMQSLGYSDAEIAERLKLAPETPAAPPANFKEFLEKAKDAPANVAQLKRPEIGEGMGEVKESYLSQNLDWGAAKKMAWMVAASCYQDAELCSRAGLDPAKGILFIGGAWHGEDHGFQRVQKGRGFAFHDRFLLVGAFRSIEKRRAGGDKPFRNDTLGCFR